MPNVKLENLDSVLRENLNQMSEIGASIIELEKQIQNKKKLIRTLQQNRELLLRERKVLVNIEPVV